jgi:hypothetical protein
MPNESQYDVFLSQSTKDKAVVHSLAKWLRQDGLLTESQPPTLNFQPLRGSDWAQLEADGSEDSGLMW